LRTPFGRRLPLAFMSVSLALASIAVSGTAAHADSLSFWGNVCHNTTSQCINNTLGRPNPGNLIQFWAHTRGGDPNNEWNVWTVGHVNCTGDGTNAGFPFGGLVSTSKCNSWGLDGDAVMTLQWAPNGSANVGRYPLGLCLDQHSWTANNGFDTAVDFEPCDRDNHSVQARQWIRTRFGFFIGALGTVFNNLTGGNGKRVYLGSCDSATNDANGAPVCMTENFGYAWSFLSPP